MQSRLFISADSTDCCSPRCLRPAPLVAAWIPSSHKSERPSHRIWHQRCVSHHKWYKRCLIQSGSLILNIYNFCLVVAVFFFLLSWHMHHCSVHIVSPPPEVNKLRCHCASHTVHKPCHIYLLIQITTFIPSMLCNVGVHSPLCPQVKRTTSQSQSCKLFCARDMIKSQIWDWCSFEEKFPHFLDWHDKQ